MISFNSICKQVWDFIGIPFRFVLFDQKWLPKFGWTTLEEERIKKVLPHVNGALLDIGAGYNLLVKSYHNGIGVDIFDWGGGALVVENTSNLPFQNNSFDTITFIACLNHIPYRNDAIIEAKRLLKNQGKVVVTMINPFLGEIGHKIWWYGEDKHRGGMKEGEVGGLWNRDIIALFEQNGFKLELHKPFQLGLNNLLIFSK